MVRNIKLILEYDGTRYSGWQSQANAVGIQDVVKQAIEKMIEETITLNGASRTDAGVHALGQVACFKTTRDSIPCAGFLKGLNSALPEDIRIVACEEAPFAFHPTLDAKRKTYQYLIGLDEVASALWRERAWWVKPPLDWEAMEEASRFLIGEHDFKSFQAANSDAKTSVRNLEKVSLRAKRSNPGESSGLLRRSFGPPRNDIFDILFSGPGFLKHMVRNIVGTLVDVGRGKLRPSDVKEILEARDRTKAGQAAPPQGLYLVKVEY